ncbi:serine/threonine protein kinase [Variovorax saccharolyticus]|uniref:serine/threonine protein kinase n=1 Tax=Variovorax saccharolyticus TaxID=3053516 RepID=UPI002576C6A1|nr:serine/threonine-protein kinase [Variovorax sp. J31P216]MDM0028304.1 serine/threonine-protein kinase [Variovorax sp. J31P216]
MQCITALPVAALPPQEKLGEAKTVPYVRPTQASGGAQDHAPGGYPGAIHALPEGTEIEGFRVLRQIGEGGFGIVYLAWDPALERHVAIKEYMPSSLAVRGAVSLEVSMRSEQHRETFDAGLKSFVNEARLLARFDHPALVKVFRYWAANGTAYMAMPYYEGPTLKTALAQLGTRAPESLLREWLEPLLDALTVLHREQCYHRDISPDNILLTASGPLLLDFGAARHVINDRTQVLTTMLKPGFAPVEQYGGTMLQGAWTDLYALAGVLHYAIVGRPPIASVVRVVKDPVQPLALTHAGRYSGTFLRAIDAALAVRPESRPQDVAEFRALLEAARQDAALDGPGAFADATPIAATVDVLATLPPASIAPVAQSPRRRHARHALLLVLVCATAGAALWHGERGSSGAGPSSTAAVAADAAPSPAIQPAKPVPVPVIDATAATTRLEPLARDVEPKAGPGAPASALPAATPPARVAARKAVAIPAARVPAEGVVGVSEKNRTVSEDPATVSSYIPSSRSPRCSDLVLKSSLESLNPEEAAFQKTRCK